MYQPSLPSSSLNLAELHQGSSPQPISAVQDARNPSESQEQVLVNMKDMLAKQQEELNSLKSKLILNSMETSSTLPTATHSTQPTTMTSQSQPSMLLEQHMIMTRNQVKLFPQKLYYLLEMVDAQSFGPCSGDIISWLPHGRAFKVHNETRFMKVIAPLFFKQCKFRSFSRQLNLWGFKK